MILKAMAQGSQPMVSKPVGVRTAWCVGIGTQNDPKNATWHAVFKVRGCIPTAMVDDKSQRRYNSTQSKGREGKWLPGNLNLVNLIGWEDLLVPLPLRMEVGNCWDSNR